MRRGALVLNEAVGATGRKYSRRARPAPKQNRPPVSSSTLLRLVAAGLAFGVAGGVAVSGKASRPNSASQLAAYGAALLSASVLADSAIEHYRGNYKKPAMKVAPLAAALTLATSVAAIVTTRGALIKSAIFGGAITTGFFGMGFHIRNILRRPGGVSFNNLFYRAPFGAPAALALAGAVGVGAVRASVLDSQAGHPDPVARRETGTLMGALTALGLFGLTGEIGLLHFRGAFHNKLMYVPVLAVPLTGAAMAATTLHPGVRNDIRTRNALIGTLGLGVVGTGLHAYGVGRNMGGFYNWTQNLFQGPPIAAPPSLVGLGLIGLSALKLLTPEQGGRRHG